MVKIELQNMAGNVITSSKLRDFNQKNRSEIDLLKLINKDTERLVEDTRYNASTDFYNFMRTNNVPYTSITEFTLNKLRNLYLKGALGKLLVRFNTNNGEKFVRLSNDPASIISPTGTGDFRFAPSTLPSNAKTWNNITILNNKQAIIESIFKGKPRKSIPKSEPTKLVLVYIAPNPQPLTVTPDDYFDTTPTPPRLYTPETILKPRSDSRSRKFRSSSRSPKSRRRSRSRSRSPRSASKSRRRSRSRSPSSGLLKRDRSSPIDTSDISLALAGRIKNIKTKTKKRRTKRL